MGCIRRKLRAFDSQIAVLGSDLKRLCPRPNDPLMRFSHLGHQASFMGLCCATPVADCFLTAMGDAWQEDAKFCKIRRKIGVGVRSSFN